GLAVAELFEEATRRRTSLALILALGSLRAVRDLSGRAQPEERDLTDLHVWVDRDRQVRDVRQLEREVAVPPGVDVAGGRVDQQPETPEARLAFQTRDQVVGQRHPL